ncbi:site-2 protease family protein [Haloarculaceae archaeon H-GB2-1]|nr:site-2 protease family protein [Haloarculaceae archaeon H-GB1-1]MEA5385691.1 site-2 protease family protein [Haloarculaceae archaeon H-GB11]MEA5407192.1 site-2 protease family protein [Haloarculaceae archaeon H-GB2-1]
MVRALTWVLLGILAYTLAAMALKSKDLIPEYIRLQGPITTIHTKHGRVLLDKLAAPRRLWRAWANFGVGIALVVMALTFVTVLQSAITSVTRPESTPISDPQNVLVIPGVNEFLPLSAAPEIVFGLLVGLVVHEGGHGLLCRVEHIDIESMGLALFTLIPVGAFVEPSEESRDTASRGAQTRMFAAGVTNNFAIAAISFVLLFGPVIGSIAVAPGVPVGGTLAGSSAADAGLEHGDVVTHVNGTAVSDQAALDRELDAIDSATVELSLKSGQTVTVERELLITAAIPTLLGDTGVGEEITAVNGTEVRTTAAFRHAVADRTVVQLTTTNGTATLPVGAYAVRATAGGPLAEEGVPLNESVIITRLDDHRVPNATTLQRLLDEREPGDEATVEAYVGGERATYNVTLGELPNGGAAVGVQNLKRGYSGTEVSELGIDPYPADYFLTLLGGGDTDPFAGQVLQRLIVVLTLPFWSQLPFGTYAFAGFVGPDANFFTVGSGPLSFLDSGVFLLANVLFWTGWVNLNLGLFNCIPTFPLDGGHILRTSTESVVSRLPFDDGRQVTSLVTTSVTVVMLSALFLMIFGPQLFS